MRAGQLNNGPSEAAANQVRHLYEDRSRVAAEAGNDLLRERMAAVVVEIVVVAGVKSRARTRRPAKQRLRSQARVEGVVVEDETRERRFAELIRAAQRQDVDGVSDAISVATANLHVSSRRHLRKGSRPRDQAAGS